MVSDDHATGCRLEISVEFIAGPGGVGDLGHITLMDCFKAVALYFVSLEKGFLASIIPASLDCNLQLERRTLPATDLFELVEQIFQKASRKAYVNVLRGRDSVLPKPIMLRFLGRHLNLLGVNKGPQ